jgi:multisubunit Na+/H+ antiporter MnhG subunit
VSAREGIAAALVAAAAALEVLACAGLVLMRTALDRLHYASLGSSLPALLVAAAILAQEGLDPRFVNAALVALALAGLGPVLAHATARAVHRLGAEQASAEDP